MNNLGRSFHTKKNIIFGYISRLITIIFEFIARTIFIKILGEELLGLTGVLTNIIQVLSIAELGINNIMGYTFYEPLAIGNKEKIAKLIKFYKKIYNSIALVVFIIGIVLIPFLKYFIDVEIKNINLIYMIFITDNVLSYLFIYKGILLRADQKGYIVIKYEIVYNIIRIFLQIISLIIFKNILVYLLIKIIVCFFMNYNISKRAEKDYPYIVNIKNELTLTEKNKMKKTIKAGFIYKVSGVLLNSTDNILISSIVGTIWVGYISNYNMIIVSLASVYTILFSSITSSVGNLISTESIEKRNRVFNLMLFIGTWLALIVSICFFTLSNDFIKIWIGEEYVLENSVVLAKTIMLAMSCSLQPLFCFREALGLYERIKNVMILAALINFVLSIILGIYYGIAGILYASIISMLLTYMWYEPYILYKDFLNSSSYNYLKNKVLDYIYILIGLFIFTRICKIYQVNNWIDWIGKGFVVFILSNIYGFIIYNKKAEFVEILEKIDFKKG